MTAAQKPDIVERLRDVEHRWGNHDDRREAAVEIIQLRAQAARDEEHYNAVRAMSEKHRQLWVEAQQEADRLRSVLKAAHAATAPEWAAQIIENALRAPAPLEGEKA